MEEQTNEQTEQQSKEYTAYKEKGKLELSYEQEKIKKSRLIFFLISIVEVVLFCVGLYLTATFVDEEISGDDFIGIDFYFILCLPLWIKSGMHYFGIRRWRFECDGTYICYTPKYGRVREFQMKDISVIEITRDTLIIRNQYREIVVKEKLMPMPGGIELLCAMRANYVPIEFLPGTEIIKQTIIRTMDYYDNFNKTCMVSVPGHEEEIKYAQEPESEKCKHNIRQQNNFVKLLVIIAIIYFIITKVMMIFNWINFLF